MQTTQELLNDDHIAYVTYPLLQDNKLIVAVLENLNNTALRIMEAVLQQEETNQENFKGKYEIFKERAKRYQIEEAEVKIIQELKSLSDQRKKSDMEFIRKDKYILWDPYKGKLKELTMQSMKDYIIKIKPLLRKINANLQNVRRTI